MNLPSAYPTRTRPAGEGDYGNFKQPWKLVWRMLTSGNRAAISALCREGFKKTVTPVDWALSQFETDYDSTEHTTSAQPILLVVGAPRSGTTLVYQTLAHCCEVSYFSNLTALFPRAPILATRWFSHRFGVPATDFRSFYGQTTALSDPNDGFVFWNRWLGDDRYSPTTELPPATIDSMLNFLRAWTTTFRLPFLNKNNRNTSCIALLAKAIPEAQFVVVRRNAMYVAQSLIHARKNIQGDKRASWGLMSRSVRGDQDPLGYVDDICDQVLEIERDLQLQLNQVSASRIHSVAYESFCRDPVAMMEQIHDAIPDVRLRTDVIQKQPFPFKISNAQSVDDDELRRIQARLPFS